MQEIPTQPIPAQVLKSVVGGQNCTISIYQKPQGLFVDVASDGVAIVAGVLALNAVPLVCRDYAGFVGNLLFIDSQGLADPLYSGLGSRFALVYITADEYDFIRQ